MSQTKQSKAENSTEIQYNGNRRDFLKFGGATLAATGLIMAGCRKFLTSYQMGAKLPLHLISVQFLWEKETSACSIMPTPWSS
ncbi:twin-arginine translocation signal domain-containing protein [Algoriphagus boritolerans]|uniref:twin-arginine translocation signal domain-containing protein n=1 Tax=Algoriphagus boritolerans TaxID=308111 RepID=UPI002FCE66BC